MRGSRNFRQGGGGSRSVWQKKSSDNVFFFFFFALFYLVLSLFYRSQMVNFKEIYHFSRFQRGSNIFQGVQLFPRGVQLLIPYRNPYNLWFSRGGGSGPPVHPLDPHLLSNKNVDDLMVRFFNVQVSFSMSRTTLDRHLNKRFKFAIPIMLNI